MGNGFESQIENAIIEIDGADKIEKWIKRRQGTCTKPIRSDNPPCPTCRQPIYESPLRDYTSVDGRQKAMLEILDSKKPMYAQAVTDQLCKLEREDFPPKIIEFFEKIKAEVSL